MSMKELKQESLLAFLYNDGMKKLLIIAVIILGVVGCATVSKLQPKQEELSAMQQKVPDVTLDRLVEGYKLYKTKCSGCHGLHSPREYTAAQWDKNLEEMFPKAKIGDDASKSLIRDYLHAKSK